MKNHELLDMIGEVNEDYVLEAGDNVVRPRFGWKTVAACAACAALVLCTYPAGRMARTVHSKIGHGYEEVPLHEYTVVEGGGDTMDTLEDMNAPAAGEIGVPGQDALNTMGGERPESDPEHALDPDAFPDGGDMEGESYMMPEADAAVDEAAAGQYDALLRGLGGQGGYEPDTYPDWYGGAWIDHGGGPDAPSWLTVAIVNGFRTDELEAQIMGWCGGEIAFTDAKYSLEHLNGLMDPATAALDGTGLSCGIGVDVIANCLGVDLYSDGAVVSDAVLAKLAQLDPAGDAIRVRVFTQSMNTLTDEAVKGPVPNSTVEPVFDGARAEPSIEAGPAPGGVTQPGAYVEEGGAGEAAQPAKQIEELPQAKYDIIYGAAE